jgi:hypothetical protein
MALRNVLNSIFKTACFSDWYFVDQRPVSGSSNANHALSVQAKEAMTMYAQLLTSVSVGIRIALTPFLSCSLRFSWLQRPLAL